MKKLFFILILIFQIIFSYSQISEKAKIYVLTCSPGNELYQAFGHSAIWVEDSVTRINYIFNYGTFDFNTPHFYTNFIRGRLNYMLSVEYASSFIQEYSRDDRDVWKSELNLTRLQKNKLFNFLMWNAQPENKYYLYDFFKDNCASRIIDVLNKVMDDSIIYPKMKINKTYRQSLAPYLKPRPWTRFGINLLLGLPADEKLNVKKAAYLPAYVDTILQKAQVKTPTGTKPLVVKRDYMVEQHYNYPQATWITPSLVFWILAILIVIAFFIERVKKKNYRWIDFVFLFIIGLAGLVMLFMWFGTDHSPTKWNLNIIWAFPLHVVYVFYYIKNKRKKLIKYYSLIFAIVNLLLIITFKVFPQQFDVALLPVFFIFTIMFFREFVESRKS